MPIPESIKPILKLSLPVILIGGLAGLFTAIASGTYLIRYSESLLQTNTTTPELSQTKPRPLPGSVEEALENVRRSSAPALVLFYSSYPPGHTITPGSELGAGVVVTSDGWVATSADVVNAAPANYLAQVGDASFAIDTIFYDKLSKLAMVHLVEASGLPVAPFGASEQVEGGEAVYVLVGANAIVPTAVVNPVQPLPTASVNHAAEAFVSNMALANQIILPSSLVVNSSGELIALTLGQTEGAAGGVGALPMHQILSAIKSLIRSGELSRASLGVTLSASNAEIVSVVAGSAAAKAGLQKGDLLLRFADVEVSAKQSLADIIADYNPGDRVAVTVDRAGTEVQIEVELGKQ